MRKKQIRSELVRSRFYGRQKLLGEGYEALPRCFVSRCMACLHLSAYQVTLLAVLFEFKKEKDDDPFPSMALVGERAGIHREAARRAVRQLAKDGFIHITKQRGKASFISLFPLMQRLEQFPVIKFINETKATAFVLREQDQKARNARREKESIKPKLGIIAGGRS